MKVRLHREFSCLMKTGGQTSLKVVDYGAGRGKNKQREMQQAIQKICKFHRKNDDLKPLNRDPDF